MSPVRHEPLHNHSHLVDLVASAGVVPPDEWVRLRVRLKMFNSLGTECLSRLTDAVIAESSDVDIATLRAAAYAEQLANVKVDSAVQQAVLRQMVKAYAEKAIANYGEMAAIFDHAAAQFAACAKQVDVETDGAAMVEQSDKAA